MPREAVLDASALLALLQGEAGAERVAATIPGARISTVNLAEVAGKLADAGMPRGVVEEVLSGLGLQVVPLDRGAAIDVGLLRPVTRSRGLSLGDRACLVLGLRSGLPVLTSDQAWSGIDIGVEIEAIR